MAKELYDLRFLREGEETSRVSRTQARFDLEDDELDAFLDRHLVAANARNRDDPRDVHLWVVEVYRFDRNSGPFGPALYRRALPVPEEAEQPRGPRGHRW